MSDGLEVARAALVGRPAWLVGGAVRDRQLGRPLIDLDLVVDGDPEQAARAVARAAGRAACFALSEDFGAWRVVARGGAWQADVEGMRGGSLEADLGLRDFTVNAIAEPIAGGEPIDPLGGLEDLTARRLRMAGPSAFADDPLRVLRLVRMAVELDLEPEPPTNRAACAQASELRDVSAERVFVELRRIVSSPRARRGIELLGELGATAVVLPELQELRGVEQSRFHHLDVYGHTLEVLDRTIELQADPAAILDGWSAGGSHDEQGRGRPAGAQPGPELARGQLGRQVAALLVEPLADELTRGEALRWGALLHDAAKPLTRGVRPEDGRVTFIGHDIRGAELAHAVLGGLRASERLRTHVAALVRHHLRLGFLVHEPQPLARRTVYSYLRACEPVAVDVTLLSVADRLATRGDQAERAIDAHMRVAHAMLEDALRWRANGPPPPLWRGDELAAELGIRTGPRVGELLEELAEAQYAGELATREQALAYARSRPASG
jgi:putative nucleotidyltransferase with HDIG domain